MKVIWLYMVPPPPHFNDGGGVLIWKCAKILWGQNFNFFLHLWGDKPVWEELKIYGVVIFITKLSLFRFFRNSQTLRNVKCFFEEFLQEMWMHQLLLADAYLCLLLQVLWKKSILLAAYSKLLL